MLTPRQFPIRPQPVLCANGVFRGREFFTICHVTPVTRFIKSFLLMALALSALRCGYHLQGAGAVAPREIYLSPLVNFTDKLDLGAVMTAAVREELAQRARGRQPSGPENAGATLSGEITYYGAQNVTTDPRGFANRYEIVLKAKVLLTARDGKVVYRNDSFIHREVYERPEGLGQFYDQEPQAQKALARAFARDLLDTIAEGF